MTPTTSEQTTALVFKDQAGDYFLVPREGLEQGRVLQERTAELERLVADTGGAQTAAGDDVRGHLIWGLVILAEVAVGTAFVIGVTGPEVEVVDSSGPTWSQLINQTVQAGQQGQRPR